MATVLPLDVQNSLALARGADLPQVTPATGQSLQLDLDTGELIVNVRFITGNRVTPPITWAGGPNANPSTYNWTYDPSIVPAPTGSWVDLLKTVGPGSWVVLTSSVTGGVVGVYRLTTDSEQVIYLRSRSIDLVPANFAAPQAPANLTTAPMPQTPVLINYGALYDMNGDLLYVCSHEQFWQLGGVTASLAPGETRTMGYVSSVGRLDSTTDQSTIQKSLSASISGSASWGWGSISASVSASLSSSSTVTHTSSITTSEVISVQEVITNDTPNPVSVLEWQLVDRYVIIVSGQQIALIDAAQAASIIQMVPSTANLGKKPA
jgi:hypothetical protein